MTYEAAVAQLEAIRHSGSVERVQQIIDAYERHEGSADFAESSRLLLHACDVLNSHDFGDRKGQVELIRIFAQRALVQCDYSSVEQELRLLAHLHPDHEEVASTDLWRRNRLARTRKWLRALQVLFDAIRDSEASALPAPTVPARAGDLPSGIAAEHVTDGTLRRDYRSTVEQNRQAVDEFALQWQFKRLRGVYEPLAAKYIASAYAREPHDLGELKQLLNEYDWFTTENLSTGRGSLRRTSGPPKEEGHITKAEAQPESHPHSKASEEGSSRSANRKVRRKTSARRSEN